MVTTILALIIIAFVVIIMAMPFEALEMIINGVITSVNIILNVLSGIGNVLTQLLMGALEMIVNLIGALIYNSLASIVNSIAGTSYTWHTVDFYAPIISLSLPYFRFPSSFEFYSPIGVLLSSIFADPMLANITGAIGLGALLILIIFIVAKIKR